MFIDEIIKKLNEIKCVALQTMLKTQDIILIAEARGHYKLSVLILKFIEEQEEKDATGD